MKGYSVNINILAGKVKRRIMKILLTEDSKETEKQLNSIIKTDKELVNEVVRMDPTISELHEKTESARLNTEESEIMERFMKTYKKHEQEDIDWNEVREKGKREGIKKGEEKGKREGIKEGIKKGKEEKNNQIALNLKTKGYSLEEIKEITGLSIKEIESLSENAK
jgi:flagellar biosynthesis/type III secretory pathway protein FliH